MRWLALFIGSYLLLLSHCIVAQTPVPPALEPSRIPSAPPPPTPPSIVSRQEDPDVHSISPTEDVSSPAITPSHSLSSSSQSKLSPNRTRTRSRSASIIRPHTFNHTFVPFTTHRPPPPVPIGPPPDGTSSGSHGQPVVAIVFECFAGVLGLFLLAGLTRCVYKYKRAPSRDRIAALISRHQLDREMAQIERSNLERRARPRASMAGPPPPPYQHAPAYDSVVVAPENAQNV